MKQLEKMSLANVRSKLTRKEMSNIMAGSSSGGNNNCPSGTTNCWCNNKYIGCTTISSCWNAC